jgi:hypothetical protein
MTATCFSNNDENKYCVTGDFLTTGISLDSTNPEGGTQIGTEEASYTSDIFCNPAGWSSLRWRAYAIPTNPTTGMLIGYEVREGDDYTSLGDWSGMADACGDITYTLSGYKYFQIRFIFFPETIATDTDLVYLKRAD